MSKEIPAKNRFATAAGLLVEELRETFLMASSSLAAHRLRSALTLLGIMVGVFSIIVVMTTMRAMQKYIESNLEQLGGDTFVIEKWPGFSASNDSKYWNRKDITMKQGIEVAEKANLAKYVGMQSSFSPDDISSVYGKAPPGFKLYGESPGTFDALGCVVDEGRVFTDSDMDLGRNCCVLGNKMATGLFPFGSAMDQKVKIDSINYTVVGVLEPKGAVENGNQDNFVMIPLTTALSRYGSRWHSISILVTAQNREAYEDTVDQVRGILRVVRKVPPGADSDFEINSNDSTLQQINTFTFAVRAGISAISSIALIAAGIGIMNIMLVSVTERTREIGIRRAIGARKRNIMVQFIMEAVVLCELGGIVGVVLGVIAGNVGAHFLHLSPVIPFDWIFLGLLICSAVGIIFGVYPAYKAANLDPIDSLRYE
jgi:putative ABC transport system permease protein